MQAHTHQVKIATTSGAVLLGMKEPEPFDINGH